VKFLKQKREEVAVNLTPLIDVVFLLLIFFMVSTTFTKETRLTLELPEATGEPQAKAAQMIEITISAEGNYAVNGQTVVNNQMKTLMLAIDKVTQSDVSKPMVITADAQAPHQAVVTAMDAAGQMGFVNLSITTKQPIQ
jgi:biopolymer transport protein ExbD